MRLSLLECVQCGFHLARYLWLPALLCYVPLHFILKYW